MDPLDDLPADSRTELIAGVQAAWPRDVTPEQAEDVLRASEALWNALEDIGGVDTWGGMEFVGVFPHALSVIYKSCNGS